MSEFNQKKESGFNKFLNNSKKACLEVGGFFHNLNKKPGTKSFFSGLISIVIGLLFGLFVMLIVKPDKAGIGFITLLTEGFSANNIGSVIFKSIPLVFSGLSIAFAFNLGLFNIGITGQVTFGAFCSLLCGLSGANWFICLLVGMLSGALIGLIIGFLKSKFHVNEVLSGIMLNWIVYYFVGLFGKMSVPKSFIDPIQPQYFKPMPVDGRMPSLGIPNMPEVSVGLIFALLIVALIFICLNFTTFGFELKMTGRNAHASKYAGVNHTKATILSLTISGALAGIAGYMLYANPGIPPKFLFDSSSNTLLADGFAGISVSLIAQNSPIGCIISSLFLTLIDQSRNALVSVSGGVYNAYYADLIKAVIIYAAALSSFFKIIFTRINDKVEISGFFDTRTKCKRKYAVENKEGETNV